MWRGTLHLMHIHMQDMDQEVKEASLSTLAILIASFGDVLSDKINDCLPVVMQRLSNELTRLSALRAITKIASSPLQIDLTTFINPAVWESFCHVMSCDKV